ncbi:hypothetical protein [Heyndrickxia coagulans]|uniref:hypothetical protein n=1 Tax=Heyndrickxia coagulans TaxID=1398 RepID=UPI0006288609|nr:hypothetical protein [Heyndrickxia coagulans]
MNAAYTPGEQIGVKDQHLLVSAEEKGAPASFFLRVKDQHLLRSVVTWSEANAFGIPKSGSNQLLIVTTMN